LGFLKNLTEKKTTRGRLAGQSFPLSILALTAAGSRWGTTEATWA
jgi:hypothetical protein